MCPTKIDFHARLVLEMLEEAKAFNAPLEQEKTRQEHGRRVEARQQENSSWVEWRKRQKKLAKEKSS
tara:strand:- start:1871 stop:2071 length:201 start_codon:yes stop_codon:yes gene_type:complete